MVFIEHLFYYFFLNKYQTALATAVLLKITLQSAQNLMFYLK